MNIDVAIGAEYLGGIVPTYARYNSADNLIYCVVELNDMEAQQFKVNVVKVNTSLVTVGETTSIAGTEPYKAIGLSGDYSTVDASVFDMGSASIGFTLNGLPGSYHKHGQCTHGWWFVSDYNNILYYVNESGSTTILLNDANYMNGISVDNNLTSTAFSYCLDGQLFVFLDGNLVYSCSALCAYFVALLDGCLYIGYNSSSSNITLVQLSYSGSVIRTVSTVNSFQSTRGCSVCCGKNNILVSGFNSLTGASAAYSITRNIVEYTHVATFQNMWQPWCPVVTPAGLFLVGSTDDALGSIYKYDLLTAEDSSTGPIDPTEGYTYPIVSIQVITQTIRAANATIHFKVATGFNPYNLHFKYTVYADTELTDVISTGDTINNRNLFSVLYNNEYVSFPSNGVIDPGTDINVKLQCYCGPVRQVYIVINAGAEGVVK